jgi:hypothetical protein
VEGNTSLTNVSAPRLPDLARDHRTPDWIIEIQRNEKEPGDFTEMFWGVELLYGGEGAVFSSLREKDAQSFDPKSGTCRHTVTC